jgi:hypothetical protein
VEAAVSAAVSEIWFPKSEIFFVLNLPKKAREFTEAGAEIYSKV